HFTSAHTYCECGDGVRCEQFTKLNPPFGKQYFFLDPNFPSRLNKSRYVRTVEFVQFLFRKYSTSGLSYATDRDVAIDSLIERMAQVLETEVRYGIFRCFFGSLLLWKRDKDKTSPISYSNRSVPSWSWMAYPGGIDFIVGAKRTLKVPRAVDLGLIEDGKALNVKVRKFSGDFRMEDKGEEYAIVDGTEQVGLLWRDMADPIRLEDCNCVVVSMVEDEEKEGARQTYHVLIILEKAEGGGYERVGAGKVEARYVSSDCVAGTLW
ncbi:hypothetical protein QBC37DRAFT_464877, partial [Rhypophila decipiens]